MAEQRQGNHALRGWKDNYDFWFHSIARTIATNSSTWAIGVWGNIP